MSLLRCLDVSGLFFPVYRLHESKGDLPSVAAAETVRVLRERAAAGGADYVVACCDARRCFRHDIAREWTAVDPSFKGYKGNRSERDASLYAALDRVIDNLEQDGVPIFRADGFEADDVIATLAKWAVENDIDVECVTDDKDLQALVCDRVNVVKRDGSRVGPEEVRAKFGVDPHQLSEYLAIVGDTSDNVPGVKGLGEKAAQGILGKHGGYLAAVDAARKEDLRVASAGPDDPYVPAFTQKQRTRLIEGEKAFRFSLRLTTLRADVPLDFGVVTAPREAKPKENGFNIDGYDDEEDEDEMSDMKQPPSESLPPMGGQTTTVPLPANDPPHVVEAVPASAQMKIEHVATVAPEPQQQQQQAIQTIQRVTEEAITPRGGAYSLTLDPRDFREARMLAKDIYDSRVFTKIDSPQKALALILAGREYGLPAMASIRLVHLIEGQTAIHAQVKIGLAMKSPRVEYMDIVDWKDDGEKSYCVWKGKRRGRREENIHKYGVEHARQQGLLKPNSNWVKMPAWMSMVRSGANLATILIPDEMAGLYTFDEMGAAEPMLMPTIIQAERAA